MVSTDEDSLICDLMEVYGIADYRSCRPSFIGTLAAGLREDSRIKMRLSGAKATTDRMIMAYCADKLANVVWMFSKDGADGVNRPVSLVKKLIGDEPEEEEWGYASIGELHEAMKKYER